MNRPIASAWCARGSRSSGRNQKIAVPTTRNARIVAERRAAESACDGAASGGRAGATSIKGLPIPGETKPAGSIIRAEHLPCPLLPAFKLKSVHQNLRSSPEMCRSANLQVCSPRLCRSADLQVCVANFPCAQEIRPRIDIRAGKRVLTQSASEAGADRILEYVAHNRQSCFVVP